MANPYLLKPVFTGFFIRSNALRFSFTSLINLSKNLSEHKGSSSIQINYLKSYIFTKLNQKNFGTKVWNRIFIFFRRSSISFLRKKTQFKKNQLSVKQVMLFQFQNVSLQLLLMLSISIQPVYSGREFIFQRNSNMLLFDQNNETHIFLLGRKKIFLRFIGNSVFGVKIYFFRYSRELLFQLSIISSKIDRF